MASQFKFFTIPINCPEADEVQLNRFLRSHRILHTIPEFVAGSQPPCWAIAVEYMEGETGKMASGGKNRSRTDYKELLSPEDFTLFVKLREWRKVVAERDGVPVYTIFSNEQLARIAEQRITTKKGLKEIDGVGESRIERFADAVIELVLKNSADVSN